MKKVEDGFMLALENKCVIFGALKKTRIYNSRFDYDDYVQEAFIVYAKCYQTYSDEWNLVSFNKYAYQKIVWSIIDRLRKEQSYTDSHILDDFESLDFHKREMIDIVRMLDGIKLTKYEKRILFDHWINEMPIRVLATDLKVSCRYLREVRKKLKRKILAQKKQP